ncbi:hypothetical protein DMENIID0001_161990 [Sergentomyia squamirostris]
MEVFNVMILIFTLITIGPAGSSSKEHVRKIIHVPYKIHTIHHHDVKHVPVPVEVVKHVPIYKTVEVIKEVHVPVVQKVHVPIHVPVEVPVLQWHFENKRN